MKRIKLPLIRHIKWGLPALLMNAVFSASAALPQEWQDALTKAGVPDTAISAVIQEIGKDEPLLQHRETELMNPASVMKLVTTAAGLDLLGANYRWKTEVFLDGAFSPTEFGVFNGNLALKGYGDPKITVERWQAFMQGLNAAGIVKINGDLLIDRNFFSLSPHNPALFDNEPLKPYNVGPDALLLSFKSVRLEITPPADPKAKRATVIVEPPLPTIKIDTAPKLTSRKCGDWWRNANPSFNDQGVGASIKFSGNYSKKCGKTEHYVALLDAPHFAHGMFTYYFNEAGGNFTGNLREGVIPQNATPALTFYSLPLRDIVSDINKRSNNVMARQLFLTLAASRNPPPHSLATARTTVAEWLQEKHIDMPGLYMDNGSGLSRDSRVSAAGLLALLLYAEKSEWRDIFWDSLPIAGVDGTLKDRFRQSTSYDRARLKTGLLEGIRTLAGYVEDINGRRYAVVIMINHEHAKRSKETMETLINWIAEGKAAQGLSPAPPFLIQAN
ncbi:MAG: D-alanyl-D-alanine carboxypeptidase/D-alanyl-D-alanine-endopeptidase [Burkholderiales bacterium]|jgi:D-alanyl-D-alanine carboxypeptidase/D-alanyl-D-alanine-endopeptidase (penicillin-binding protein 4)|nr:D-alanyl-D-alanine carboxypeptidase/D-alanyl-D-alanine-endopeptidase [Burkholderiales bacterium]